MLRYIIRHASYAPDIGGNMGKQPKSLPIPRLEKMRISSTRVFELRTVIQIMSNQGKNPVTYFPLMQALDLNRFDLGYLLGHLVWLDTQIGEGLWSSFVVYADGSIGGGFFKCAEWYRHPIADASTDAEKDAFLAEQRKLCASSL